MRLLAAPIYVGAAACGVIALTLGALNGVARERDWVLTPRCMRVESLGVTLVVLTLPAVLAALLWTARRFRAPRATKRRYVVRHVALQAVLAAVAIHVIRWSQPAQGAFLEQATREDGQIAYLHRWEWGCGYRISRPAAMGTARLVTAVGPFACDVAPATIAWRGDDVVLTLADGEVAGAWRATEVR